eukprot:CAMPEP_0171142190 /NCGR_PEP_ID=MMETSP0766_2-20121228/141990_1 /TAXON_ID=439317 /ORGANISM="Gambierdiscus australes, Strain CAWD 149" /LENGTH=126 /DNA_ID=CAMNT_0011605965 /DNA_START=106 /DNA_END=486 /DNA_ORIENTATION=-
MPAAEASMKKTWPITKMRALRPVAPPWDRSHCPVENMSRSIASRMGTPTLATVSRRAPMTNIFTDGRSVINQEEQHAAKLAVTSTFLRETRSATTPQNGKKSACKACWGVTVNARNVLYKPKSLVT